MLYRAISIALFSLVATMAVRAVHADEEVAALVVDDGSGMSTAGFGGAVSPWFFFRKIDNESSLVNPEDDLNACRFKLGAAHSARAIQGARSAQYCLAIPTWQFVAGWGVYSNFHTPLVDGGKQG